MWVEQRVGPFKREDQILFPFLGSEGISSNFELKYVRLGIQTPQAPYTTETREIIYKNKVPLRTIDRDNPNEIYQVLDEHGQPIYKPISTIPTKEQNFLDINNSYCFTKDIEIETNSYRDRLHRFKIEINKDNEFYMNAGEVLEFQDLDRLKYFKVIPQQDEDAYTIIEIQYIDEPVD